MNNQETNNIDLQQLQKVNTSKNNRIESIPAKDQTHTPLDSAQLKQLSQAHRARAMARTRELIIGKGLALGEAPIVASEAILLSITDIILSVIDQGLTPDVAKKTWDLSIDSLLDNVMSCLVLQ